MRRTILLLALGLAAVGCGLLELLGDLGDAVRQTGLMARVMKAYEGLVMAHGEPGSDADALRLLEQAAGIVVERREQLRGIGDQLIDAAIGMAGLLGFQGVASGRGRQLWATLLGSLVKGHGRRVVATGASLVAAAHSGRVLGAEKVLAVVPQQAAHAPAAQPAGADAGTTTDAASAPPPEGA